MKYTVEYEKVFLNDELQVKDVYTIFQLIALESLGGEGSKEEILCEMNSITEQIRKRF